MSSLLCDDMKLLLQADIDGELSPAEAARVANHVAGCAACAALQGEMMRLSAHLQARVARHAAPPALRRAMRDLMATMPNPSADDMASDAANENGRWAPFRKRFSGFAGAAALGAVAAMVVMMARPDGATLEGQLVAGHIRALQPGHLIDVQSTDQHTVKPWFDGRLDYAPPVKDFRADGFILTGGRLDYLAGRPVAALIYGRRLHMIDVFVWPEASGALSGAAGSLNGYNYIGWHQGGMRFWAVSDLNMVELKQFAQLWQRP